MKISFVATKKTSLLFFANEVRFENGEVLYLFTNRDGSENKGARERYEREVHRTIHKKNNRDWDRDLSLFEWLRKNGVITDGHYEQLIHIRDLRNKLVHELDSFLGKLFLLIWRNGLGNWSRSGSTQRNGGIFILNIPPILKKTILSI